MNKIALRGAALLICLPVSTQALADIGYALSAGVGERCSIKRVTQSHGRNPSIVVYSNCNAAMFRLRFADLAAQSPIRSANGNGSNVAILADGVSVMPRRPGAQVTVVHFSRALPSDGPGTLTIETL